MVNADPGRFSPITTPNLPPEVYDDPSFNPGDTDSVSLDSNAENPSTPSHSSIPIKEAFAVNQASNIPAGASKSQSAQAASLSQNAQDLAQNTKSLAAALKIETPKISLSGIARLFQAVKKKCENIESTLTTRKPTISIPSSPSKPLSSSSITPSSIRRSPVSLGEKKTEALETLETVSSHISANLNLVAGSNPIAASAAASAGSEIAKSDDVSLEEANKTPSASEISGFALTSLGIVISEVFVGLQGYQVLRLVKDINDMKGVIQTLQNQKDSNIDSNPITRDETNAKLDSQIQELRDEIEIVRKQIKKDALDFGVSFTKTNIEASSLGVEIAACSSTISEIIAPSLVLGAGVISLGLAIRGIVQNSRREGKLDEEVKQLDVEIGNLGNQIQTLGPLDTTKAELEGKKINLENKKNHLLDEIKDCKSNRIQLFASLVSSTLSLAHSAIVIAGIAGVAGLTGAAMATGIGAGVVAGLGIGYLLFRNRKAIGSFVVKTGQKIAEASHKLLTNMVKGADVVKHQIRSSSISALKSTTEALNRFQNNLQLRTPSSETNPLLKSIAMASKVTAGSALQLTI